MYILALATDYDGTLAHHGRVNADTLRALERFKQTGRRLLLVTGRELADLRNAFPEIGLFDRIVAENGALIYDPETEQERSLGPPPAPALIEGLKQRKVEPLSVGRSIVATWEPHETTVLDVIRSLGLELQIIFNKGAVMILPSGMNKATGLAAALRELELSPHNVVGVGDAENDHAFLHACGCAAAVANALPTVKATADLNLRGDHGAGVIDLMERICREDAGIIPAARHGLRLGYDSDGRVVYIEPHKGNVLICGTSGVGKSNLATALTERMAEKQFEFCVLDPEGDYSDLENAVAVGDTKTPPKIDEAIKLIRNIGANVVINTQNLDVAERPEFFAKLLPRIASLRARTGRPHWLLIDEAHHLLPASRKDIAQIVPENSPTSIFITVHPEAVSPDVLRTVDLIIALGDSAADAIARFCEVLSEPAPDIQNLPRLDQGEILAWFRSSARTAIVVRADRARQRHKRHTQKYAEGDLGKDLSFYFRGADNALNLRAQNLLLFVQIAEGVDDRTWEYHLRAGHYSDWFRRVIKNEDLAREAANIESERSLSPLESRQRFSEAIRRRYTAPARAPDS